MKTFNEIYLEILKDLWYNGIEVSPRSIKCKELLSYKIILENPKDRIITIPEFTTNLKYAETEYKWYCSGNNEIDFDPLIKKIWEKYSDNGKTAASGYGKQIQEQWQWIIDELKHDKESRRCIININLPEHKIHITKDVPCTIAFQILLRNNKLNWITFIRSNDIIKGIRNDIYCFTKLQEKLASELKVEIGNYTHFIGSIHLYSEDYEKVENILKK